jgi:hypothetical protein
MPKKDKTTKQNMSDKTTLEVIFPEIVSEWHPEKNGDLKPGEFTSKSAKKIWWLCPEGHEYETSIINRTKVKSVGCPYCISGLEFLISGDSKEFDPILVVDDRDAERKEIVKSLEADGFQVEASKNAKDALKKFKNNKYCLVIATDARLLKDIKSISSQAIVIYYMKYGDTIDPSKENISALTLEAELDAIILNYWKTDSFSNVLIHALSEKLAEKDTIILKPKHKDKSKDWGSFLEPYNITNVDEEGLPTTPMRELEKLRNKQESFAKDSELASKELRDYPLAFAKFPSEEKDLFTSKNEIKKAKRIFKKCLLQEDMTEGEDFIENKPTLGGEAKNDSMLPDFIIELPDNQVILGECKLSLKPYEEYLNADNEDDKAHAEASLLTIINTNIGYLNSKRLQKIYEDKYGPFYTIYLFFPDHQALSLAYSIDPGLTRFSEFDKGYGRITFVTPINLGVTLSIKKSLLDIQARTVFADNRLFELEERIEIEEEKLAIVFEQYQELIKSIEEKDKELLLIKQESKLKDQKLKNFINENAHAIANSLFPVKLEEVAEELKEKGGFEKSVRILRQAFAAMSQVKQKTELLRIQAFSERRKFQSYILDDRLSEDSPEKAVLVPEIINTAAEHIIEQRLLNQQDIKFDNSRSHLINKSKTDISTLCNDFEDNVIFNNKITPLEWIDSKMAKTTIGNLTPTWEKIRLRKDGYAHHYLQGQWGELLVNAFKYADILQNNFLKITFAEKNINDTNWLQMTWENSCVESKETRKRSGLEGIAENLKNLNNTNDENFSLNIAAEGGKFVVALTYSSEMLLADTSWSFEL